MSGKILRVLQNGVVAGAVVMLTLFARAYVGVALLGENAAPSGTSPAAFVAFGVAFFILHAGHLWTRTERRP